MSNPTYRTINEAELIDWLGHIERGLEPQVKYNADPAKMMADAYKERGDMLYYLNHGIRSVLNEPTKYQ